MNMFSKSFSFSGDLGRIDQKVPKKFYSRIFLHSEKTGQSLFYCKFDRTIPNRVKGH